MQISVVVPAFNEERLLAESLRSICRAMAVFAARGWSAELIVCDNNSEDRTAEIARAAGARVVFEPVNQIARARNTGAAHAAGEWLIFVDADSCPSPELFAEAADAIQGGRCLAGGATLAFPAGGGVIARLWLALWNAASRMTRWAAGCFVFCETAAFRELAGFSEQLYASEEIDLFRRLKRLARRKRRSVAILHRHPLLTSDRKVHLYTWREHLRVLLGTLASGGGSLRRRERCFVWYDGRR
jgi:glycosyltransferase involved in cell wall biosynthesis